MSQDIHLRHSSIRKSSKALAVITAILLVSGLPDAAVANEKKVGKSCNKIGERINLKESYLECRWKSEGKKVYFLLTKIIEDLNPSISPEPYTNCRLPEAIKNRLDGWNSYVSIAYPVVKSTLDPLGSNTYLFIPIDFKDAVGVGSPEKMLRTEVKKIYEWLDWYSNGKVSIQIDYPKSWLRSSKLASELTTWPDLAKPSSPGDKLSGISLVEALLADVEQTYDLSKYQGVYFLPSLAAKSLENGVFLNNTFKTPKGSFTGGGYIYGNSAFEREEFVWAFIIHDFLHSFGLALHAPGQELPFGIQDTTFGGLGINEWDTMSLGWTNDGDVYCVSKENLKTAEIQLVPIEREQKGTQSIMIKLSDTQVLVIESHRRDKWGMKFLPGFYGVSTYLVDTSVQNDPTKPASKSTRFANYIKNTQTNKDRLVNRRYWQETDAKGNRKSGWVTQPTWDMDFILFENESLVTNGIKITLKKSGHNDLVRIERAQ